MSSRRASERDDFHPSDWDADLPISADFVDSTFARVRADRREIEAEAARVDDIELPRELLDAFHAPEPSADFVARTAARVGEARETAWRRTLGTFEPPPPTEDFVERTLLALRIDRSSLRLVRGGDGAAPRSRAPRRLAIAALVVAALALWFTLGGDTPGPTSIRVADRTFSPVPWSSALAELATADAGDLDFQPVAGLAVGGLR